MDSVQAELETWAKETYEERRRLMKQVRLLRAQERRIGKVLAMLEVIPESIVGVVNTEPSPYIEAAKWVMEQARAAEQSKPEQPKDDPILWSTESRTQQGVTHHIRQGGGGPYCDCKAAQFGNRDCYHMRAYTQHLRYEAGKDGLYVIRDAAPPEASEYIPGLHGPKA